MEGMGKSEGLKPQIPELECEILAKMKSGEPLDEEQKRYLKSSAICSEATCDWGMSETCIIF